MQYITRGMALCILTGVVITGAPVHDTFADESARPQTAADPMPAEPVRPPAPEGANPQSENGEVQERGLFEHRLDPGILNPQATTPAPATIPAPAMKIPVPGVTAPRPDVALPPDRYQAPTPNLTIVANALRLNHKSLTTLVTLPPNLPVTRPVNIGIIYTSPTGIGQTGQSYAHGAGNRFLYNDREGDGKPRAMGIAITLTEPSAGASGIYHMNWRANLDPLYDVAMGQFEFTLLNSCDTAGQTEIKLAWSLPDSHSVTQRGFSTAIIPWKEAIPEFRWVGKEIGWSQPLHNEEFKFIDDDPGWVEVLSTIQRNLDIFWDPPFPANPLGPGHLLENPTGPMWVERKLKAENDSCKGKYKYFRNKQLLLYPTLQPR